MKNTTIKLTAIIVLAIGLFSFTHIISTFKADPATSTLAWYGSKITGDGHEGFIKLKSGELIIEDGKLKGGNFVIDMNSITNTDIGSETYSQKLVDHLKSADFFDTENFPETTFKITSYTEKGNNKYDVKGNLTLKGKTNEISFPATVIVKENTATAEALITFDRSRFDVRYGSDNFFDNLGNKAISNEIALTVMLHAKR